MFPAEVLPPAPSIDADMAMGAARCSKNAKGAKSGEWNKVQAASKPAERIVLLLQNFEPGPRPGPRPHVVGADAKDAIQTWSTRKALISQLAPRLPEPFLGALPTGEGSAHPSSDSEEPITNAQSNGVRGNSSPGVLTQSDIESGLPIVLASLPPGEYWEDKSSSLPYSIPSI